MRRRSKYHLLLFLSLFCSSLLAQEITGINTLLEHQIEENEYLDLQAYTENLNELIQHPINLNKADLSELEESELFTAKQINSFLKHRESAGKLISIYELQSIPNFELDFIRLILPYVKVKQDISDYHMKFGELVFHGKHQFFLRYQQNFPNKDGFKDAYTGNPSKIYFRYKYNNGTKFYYGLIGEKDAGEAMFRENNKQGFDFYSFHIFWRKDTKLRALALGDYHMNMGQGLVLWTGFGFKKSNNPTLIKKEGSVLKPFTSVNEYLFLRGFAFTYQIGNFQFTPFFSAKKIDANLSYVDSLENELESNRIQINGFHRTESEINGKNALTEYKSGFNAQYKIAPFHLGTNFLYTRFSKPIRFDEKPYNRYQFQGDNLINASLDYHVLLKSFHFFGEQAISWSSDEIAYAFLNGMLFNPAKIIDASIVHRYFAPNYQTNNYTNAFGESTNPNNEHGVYLGLRIQPSKRFSVSTYYDQYFFPWLKYKADKPSKGNDFTAQINIRPFKAFEFYVTYKREQKEENTKIDLGTNNALLLTATNRKYLAAYFGEEQFDFNDLGQEVLRVNQWITKQEIESATMITPVLNQRLRFHLTYNHLKTWTFQSRLEFSFYNNQINKPNQGTLFYQDIKFHPMQLPFSFSVRFVLFDIPQYNTRIYTYENDVLYQFSIPALYNTGLRFYINAQYKVNKHFQVWLRFSHTYYSQIDEIGSGNERLEGNKKYDIKMQLRYQF